MSQAALEALRRGALAGARELRLAGCGLVEFPPEIYGLAETLEVLDLGQNALTELPADLSRLRRLRVLFASGNRFTRLPPALGDCPVLSQIGCRGAGVVEVPAEALPPRLRWLTLTDNAIESLPEALGARPALAKLMLAGNRLRQLPESLLGAPALELLRIAANGLEELPSWLEAHPRLAWLGWAGNAFDDAPSPPGPAIPWRELELGAPLGEGASGLVRAARWRSGAVEQAVALKLFKGAVTSDGLPGHEMAACLLAGDHPQLLGALGRLAGHPEGLEGLVMPLLPAHWRALAGPPSLESCTRDIHDPGLRLAPAAALRLARCVADAVAHLHGRGLLHGDLYAHNILWDGGAGPAVLSDFGAACFPPAGRAAGLQRLETRAFGLLLEELLARLDGAPPAILPALRAPCLAPRPADRPAMAEVAQALRAA